MIFIKRFALSKRIFEFINLIIVLLVNFDEICRPEPENLMIIR